MAFDQRGKRSLNAHIERALILRSPEEARKSFVQILNSIVVFIETLHKLLHRIFNLTGQTNNRASPRHCCKLARDLAIGIEEECRRISGRTKHCMPDAAMDQYGCCPNSRFPQINSEISLSRATDLKSVVRVQFTFIDQSAMDRPAQADACYATRSF